MTHVLGMLDYRSQILTLAGAYSTATGKSESRIATIAQSRGTFFRDLRDGGRCTVDTYLKVKRWFADHWPEGVDWPEGVHGPGILPDAPANETTNTAA